MSAQWLTDDEFIILMEMMYTHPLYLTEVEQLRAIGVQTVLTYPFWSRIEVRRGEYDFSDLDTYLERNRKAGMKTMLSVPRTPPVWFPDAWYLRTVDGHIMRDPPDWCVLSPWHAEAMRYQDDFCRRMRDRYNSADVLCVRSGTWDAEMLLPYNKAAYYDDTAIASFQAYVRKHYPENRIPDGYAPSLHPERHQPTNDWLRESLVSMVVHQQKIFAATPHREIWMMLHHDFEKNPWSGNQFIPEVYRAIKVQVNPSQQYNICYTQMNQPPELQAKCIDDIGRYGIKMFCGSEWPEGLAVNTQRAIEMGMRGFLTGALHPFNGHRRLETWMVVNFQASMNAWRKARQ